VIWASVAPSDRKIEFEIEMKWRGLSPIEKFGDIYLFSGEFQPLAWAKVNWKQVERVNFSSISEAAKKLKIAGKHWMFYSNGFHRRGSLIEEKFRIRKKELSFPLDKNPFQETGSFSLISESEMIFAKERDRVHPLGELEYTENKEAPSRAYLKLWEALTEFGAYPKSGDRCLELGASPGGWTWVLRNLGAMVESYDRSPLDPRFDSDPLIKFHAKDAFQALPDRVGHVDWLFSDLICYPEKLADFLKAWQQKNAPKMICTLKFQGEFQPKVLEPFLKTGRVLHLNYNKHELTWLSF
jgi:23S rRNA (cytidine2498-2'-O)-methyltransferase